MSHSASPIALRRALRHAAVALALALSAALLVGSTAQAADYRVYACKAPDGSPVPLTDRWYSSAYQPFSAAAQGCSTGSPLALFMGSPGAPSVYPTGMVAQWRFASPMPLKGAWVRRSVSTVAGVDLSATPEYQAVASRWNYPSTVLETCAAFVNCQLGNAAAGDDPRNDVYWSLPEGTSHLDLFVHCGGSPGGNCSNGASSRVVAAFHRIELLVDDPNDPVLSPGTTPTGTLLQNGNQAGVRTFKLKASDGGSGVYQVVTKVDGVEVQRVRPDSNGGRCADAGLRAGPDFREFTPCPTSNVSIDLSLDSTKFADGRHTVTVDVLDAAGNAARVFGNDVLFENFPPPANLAPPTLKGPVAEPRPGDTLTAVDGIWQGAGIAFSHRWQRSVDGAAWADIPAATGVSYAVTKDDIGRRLRVLVTAKNVEGATQHASDATGEVKTGATIVTAGFGGLLPTGEVPSGAAGNGAGGDPSTAQLVVDREQRTVQVKHGAKIVITGRLVDANAEPIANADVDVYEQLVLAAEPWQKIGTVKTDSQGGYVYRPKTTASRRLRFAYSDRRDAADYRATREVLVAVRAKMSIKAKQRVLSPRGLIRLRGRITVDRLPKTGTWIDVQVRDAGVWRTVAARKTSSKGLWTFKHRLRQSRGVTFRFRARLRVVGDVASAEAKTSVVKIRVRR